MEYRANYHDPQRTPLRVYVYSVAPESLLSVSINGVNHILDVQETRLLIGFLESALKDLDAALSAAPKEPPHA